MQKTGFTTTVPVEVILAAGRTPLDLNNAFITSADPSGMVDRAEAEGLPRTTCGWIKGLYLAAREAGLSEVVAVTQGDCSNTHALMELWQTEGVLTVPFAYPYDRDADLLRLQIRKLMDALGTTEEATDNALQRLKPIRDGLRRLDELTWREGKVSGGENHLWLVSSSDFNGDPDRFETELGGFITEAERREPNGDADTVRLGFIGVPPIFGDLYETLESAGASVVFNETQRQFSMPYDTADIYGQYARYTYPYDVFGRIADIKEQAALRRLDGIIHYCQSFCFRAIEDLIIRRAVGLPILTLEGDRPGPVDARSRIRLEGFVEMLKGRK
ncbi:MAG: 2-hydroxyacyl-CoA dehydratase [Nitrospirae bacterium]|nr:2-hydroxyacyl-CoA dehydratase [Nitrospirota bacterium]